jgi:uncharacterized membrane protein HdeD (DUF308 family)
MSTPPDTSADHPGTTARRRSGWDLLGGVLLIVAGLFILGDVVIATVISVFLLGWMTVISGVVQLVGALFRIKSGGFWSAALGGVVLTVLGLFILRNPVTGAITLTLLAGSTFLVAGVVRVVNSGESGRDRWLVMVSGLISVCLGLFVLFNPITATLTLLGFLLGIQILVEGLTLLLTRRTPDVRPEPMTAPATMPAARA